MKQTNSKSNSRMYLLIGLSGLLICVVLGVAGWTAVNYPVLASILEKTPASASQPDILWAQVEIAKPVVAPIDVSLFASQNPEIASSTSQNVLPTITVIPELALESASVATEVPMDTPTVVPTDAPTNTPEATETPAQLAMDIIPNTPTSEYIPPPTSAAPQQPSYASSGNGVRWIDVDLTNQSLYAYEGDVMVNSFIVSTGTWQTPTVTGQFNVYIKYRSAPMSGPGYYLPDVPYIMYFYGDYGLHGTYWHNNFGTPMSHGCVNLRTGDAGWLYNWASVGTLVNIHY
jgi:lipoprotein-anchoring transpeptidase ErfK/SrfK